MNLKYFGLAAVVLFSGVSNLHAYSTLRAHAYCQDRDSLKALAQDAKTDRVLNGIRVTVELRGRKNLNNIKYGAFVEAERIPSTERAAFSQEMSNARKSGKAYTADLRTSQNFGLSLRHLRPGATFASPDPLRPFELIIRHDPESHAVEVSQVNKLYGGKYDTIGFLTTTVRNHPKNGTSEVKQINNQELLCNVLSGY